MFKFYNEKSDGTVETHETELREIITPNMKAVASEILREMQTSDTDVFRDILEIVKANLADVVNDDDKPVIGKIQNLVETGKIPMEKWDELIKSFSEKDAINPANIKRRDGLHIRIFKLLVNEKQLPTAWKTLFNEDYDGAFWQQQDLLKIYEQVEFFRSKIGV